MNSLVCHLSATVLALSVIACQERPSASKIQETVSLDNLKIIELTSPSQADPSSVRHCIIWLHGLGATANDFPPIVPHLGLEPSRPVRFIFPQAPDRPITINGGYVMPGWYDIKGMDLAAKEDRSGLEESRSAIEAIVAEQINAGIPAKNIILAGFSQGGAVTYYTGTRSNHRFAGMLALSTYLVFAEQTAQEHSSVNINTPILATHGMQDPVVPVTLGQQSVEKLQQLGYQVDWKAYTMQHEVSLPQIRAIGEWIDARFSND